MFCLRPWKQFFPISIVLETGSKIDGFQGCARSDIRRTAVVIYTLFASESITNTDRRPAASSFRTDDS